MQLQRGKAVLRLQTRTAWPACTSTLAQLQPAAQCASLHQNHFFTTTSAFEFNAGHHHAGHRGEDEDTKQEVQEAVAAGERAGGRQWAALGAVTMLRSSCCGWAVLPFQHTPRCMPRGSAIALAVSCNMHFQRACSLRTLCRRWARWGRSRCKTCLETSAWTSASQPPPLGGAAGWRACCLLGCCAHWEASVSAQCACGHRCPAPPPQISTAGAVEGMQAKCGCYIGVGSGRQPPSQAMQHAQ